MTSQQAQNLTRMYPEIGAGGFSRVDGTIGFYTRVNALLRPDFAVLDLGAGRGAQLLSEPASYRTKLSTLKGKVARVVGIDVDRAVLENPFLDEAQIIRIGEPYPFSDNTFDLVVSDWVLEHVTNPTEFATEIGRVLKPGGWLCARTPNRWGMIGILVNLIPNRQHARLLAHLTPDRESQDVFPTAYSLNTLAKIRRAFPVSHWEHYSYLSNPEPPYIQKWPWAMRTVRFAWRLAPRRFATVLNVFVRLKPESGGQDGS